MKIESITGYATRFARGPEEIKNRTIEIPADELAGVQTIGALLEKAYHFGQNDFQRRDCPSVSTGDSVCVKFADFGTRFYRCLNIGWAEIVPDSGLVIGPDAEDMQPGEIRVDDR